MNGIGRITAKRLHEAFDRTATQYNVAKAIRILRGTLKPDTVKETADYIRSCYHHPDKVWLQLHAADVLLGTHGVESDMYKGAPVVYLNTGDSYANTLVYFRDKTRSFQVCSWGDVAEKMYPPIPYTFKTNTIDPI